MTPDDHSKNHPNPPEHELIEKMNTIWDLRREDRLTFRQIGDRLGISHTNARKWFHEAARRKLQIGPEEEAERILAIGQIEEEEAVTWQIVENAFDENVKVKALAHLNALRKSKLEVIAFGRASKGGLPSPDELEVKMLIMKYRQANAMKEQDDEL